jgi:hypothetical protein
MKLFALTASAALLLFSAAAAQAGDCTLDYARVACKGKDAEAFKKCDGKAACAVKKETADKAACAALAAKECENSRTDITKFKAVAASFGGEKLAGGFDMAGKAAAGGPNFCGADRADMNKCE